MRNKDSHLKIKTKLETTLGYQLESHAETGLWVEKGKQPVLSFPLLSKRIPDKVTVERVRKPPQASSKTKSLRVGFLSIQEKNILRSSQFFTGGIINFYAGQRLPHCGITYQPVERLQRQFNVVTGAMIQIINVRKNHWILLNVQVTSPTVVQHVWPHVNETRSSCICKSRRYSSCTTVNWRESEMYTHQTLSTAKGLSFMWTLLHRVYVGFERWYWA